MTCQGRTAGHDGIDVRPRYVMDPRGLLYAEEPMCRGCAARLNEMGMDVRDERRDYATRPLTFPALRLRRDVA